MSKPQHSDSIHRQPTELSHKNTNGHQISTRQQTQRDLSRLDTLASPSSQRDLFANNNSIFINTHSARTNASHRSHTSMVTPEMIVLIAAQEEKQRLYNEQQRLGKLYPQKNQHNLSHSSMQGIKQSILENLKTQVKARRANDAQVIKHTKAKQLRKQLPDIVQNASPQMVTRKMDQSPGLSSVGRQSQLSHQRNLRLNLSNLKTEPFISEFEPKRYQSVQQRGHGQSATSQSSSQMKVQSNYRGPLSVRQADKIIFNKMLKKNKNLTQTGWQQIARSTQLLSGSYDMSCREKIASQERPLTKTELLPVAETELTNHNALLERNSKQNLWSPKSEVSQRQKAQNIGHTDSKQQAVRFQQTSNSVRKSKLIDLDFQEATASAKKQGDASSIETETYRSSNGSQPNPDVKSPMTLTEKKRRATLEKKMNILSEETLNRSFRSTKRCIRDGLRQVPKKYRQVVTSYFKTREFQEKFNLQKGLIGNKGTIDKVMKEVELIEEHAIEKIQQNRINLLKRKQQMLDPIRENRRNLEKERLERRFNESQAQSKARMASIQKENRITGIELERIERLVDPFVMFEERKEEQKVKYKALKKKLANLTSLNGKMLEAQSPNGTTELLQAFFERERSQDTVKKNGESEALFNDVQERVLSLVDNLGVKEADTEYQRLVKKQKTGNQLTHGDSASNYLRMDTPPNKRMRGSPFQHKAGKKNYIEQLFWRQDGIIDYPQLYLKSQTQNQSFDQELSPVFKAPLMTKMPSQKGPAVENKNLKMLENHGSKKYRQFLAKRSNLQKKDRDIKTTIENISEESEDESDITTESKEGKLNLKESISQDEDELPWIPQVCNKKVFMAVMDEVLHDYNVASEQDLELRNKKMQHRVKCAEWRKNQVSTDLSRSVLIVGFLGENSKKFGSGTNMIVQICRWAFAYPFRRRYF